MPRRVHASKRAKAAASLVAASLTFGLGVGTVYAAEGSQGKAKAGVAKKANKGIGMDKAKLREMKQLRERQRDQLKASRDSIKTMRQEGKDVTAARDQLKKQRETFRAEQQKLREGMQAAHQAAVDKRQAENGTDASSKAPSTDAAKAKDSKETKEAKEKK